jgi:hypothetical protein
MYIYFKMISQKLYVIVRDSTSLKDKCIAPMGSNGLFLTCEENRED